MREECMHLVDAPSLFSLLLFFFLMAEVVDGAINGDQAKGCTSI
jgi:DNA-directed RNA polymerase subunit E'/Rpb7